MNEFDNERGLWVPAMLTEEESTLLLEISGGGCGSRELTPGLQLHSASLIKQGEN